MKTVHAVWLAEAGAHDPGPTLEDWLREAGFGVDDVSAVEEVLEAEAERAPWSGLARSCAGCGVLLNTNTPPRERSRFVWAPRRPAPRSPRGWVSLGKRCTRFSVDCAPRWAISAPDR